MKRTELKRKTPLRAKTQLRARTNLKPKYMPRQCKKHKCRSKQKRVKKTVSVIHPRDGTCYLCMVLNECYMEHNYLEEHHIFFGMAKRKLSELYGLKVYLCAAHHRGDINGNEEAVHHNRDINLLLRAAGQREFEKEHERDEFIEIFNENNIIM